MHARISFTLIYHYRMYSEQRMYAHKGQRCFINPILKPSDERGVLGAD